MAVEGKGKAEMCCVCLTCVFCALKELFGIHCNLNFLLGNGLLHESSVSLYTEFNKSNS